MKNLKNLMLGVLVVVFVVSLSTVSFAKGKHHKIDLNVIQKAADALHAAQPDLSAGLLTYVDEEKKEDLEKKHGNAEKEGSAEEKDEKAMKAKQEAVIKLFKDSAAALRSANPELAQKLTKYAQWKEKRLAAKKDVKKDSEKDEAKETNAQK